MAAKALMVGSIMIDLILQMKRVPDPSESVLGTTYSNAGGGKGSNSAVAAARVGADVTVYGTLGKDANGEALLGMLADEGIDAQDMVLMDGANTGMAVILLDESGQNRIIIYTGSNDETPTDGLDALFERKEYDALMLQLEIPVETNVAAFEKATAAGMVTCLDAGPAQEYPLERFAGLTILSPNETETGALVGILPDDEDSCRTAAQALLERCPSTYVVLKMGEKGCYILGEGIDQMVPAFSVKALDPTAAGDCFTGVLVSKFVETGDMVEAARYANAAAGMSVQELGAQPSLPRKDAVDAFLAQQG